MRDGDDRSRQTFLVAVELADLDLGADGMDRIDAGQRDRLLPGSASA